jgi:hypothetical protein
LQPSPQLTCLHQVPLRILLLLLLRLLLLLLLLHREPWVGPAALQGVADGIGQLL